MASWPPAVFQAFGLAEINVVRSVKSSSGSISVRLSFRLSCKVLWPTADVVRLIDRASRARGSCGGGSPWESLGFEGLQAPQWSRQFYWQRNSQDTCQDTLVKSSFSVDSKTKYVHELVDKLQKPGGYSKILKIAISQNRRRPHGPLKKENRNCS